MRVFLAGGTGLIGYRLVPELLERGDEVVLLSRQAKKAHELFGSRCECVEGNPLEQGSWLQKVDDCDAVINLTGEGIFNRRWNAEFRKVLRESRIKSTQNIVCALERKPTTTKGAPKVLINASAIGYYGPHGEEALTEESPPGSDFMADLCIQWESAARQAETAGIRVALVRIGVVLDKRGGALPKMLLPIRFFVGGPVGSGRQYVSWIHHADIVGILQLVLDNPEARGPINGTAPNPVNNWELTKTLGRVLGRPTILRAPAFGLRLALGEVANVITTGQRVLPWRIIQLGYRFRFAELESAVRDVLGK